MEPVIPPVFLTTQGGTHEAFLALYQPVFCCHLRSNKYSTVLCPCDELKTVHTPLFHFPNLFSDHFSDFILT